MNRIEFMDQLKDLLREISAEEREEALQYLSLIHIQMCIRDRQFGSGKIDRIDTCEDENCIYVKVTDYKTGMKTFDITAFYHGLQLQLPVYLNAAMDLEGRKTKAKEIVPAGIFYYRMQDPLCLLYTSRCV